MIRQGAPLVAFLLLATAVGSAVCADLGSRTMREEIQAMRSRVSPIQRLVVPRLAALVLIGVLLTGVTSFVGDLASYMFNVYLQNGTPGSFIATFSSFSTVGDLALAMVKAIVFGVIVAVISCSKRTRYPRWAGRCGQLGQCRGGGSRAADDDRQRRDEPARDTFPEADDLTWLHRQHSVRSCCGRSTSGGGLLNAAATRINLIEFFGRVLLAVPTMWARYRHELLRLLSDITWGNGSIVVGGDPQCRWGAWYYRRCTGCHRGLQRAESAGAGLGHRFGLLIRNHP